MGYSTYFKYYYSLPYWGESQSKLAKTDSWYKICQDREFRIKLKERESRKKGSGNLETITNTRRGGEINGCWKLMVN